MSGGEEQGDEWAGRLDPPPSLRERARAVVDLLHGAPLKHPEQVERDCELLDAYEDALRQGDQAAAQRSLVEFFGPRPRKTFTPEALNRALLLRGWALSKLLSRTQLGKLQDQFYAALRRRDVAEARRFLAQFQQDARAFRSDWDWSPLWKLMAREVDAAERGQAPSEEEWPPEIVVLAALWMGDTPEMSDLLTGLGFNRRALRFEERKPAEDALAEGRAEVESAEEPLEQTLRAALYVAKGDVDLRSEPFPQVGKKVRRRQRREACSELTLANQERVKPGSRRHVVSSDPEFATELGSAPVLVDRDELSKRIDSLPPAQRRAAMVRIRAYAEGRALKDQCTREGLRYKAVHEALRQARRALSS